MINIYSFLTFGVLRTLYLGRLHLRTSSSSSPSWFFESLVPVLIVFVDVLVFVHSVRTEQTSEIKTRSLRTATMNLEIQDGGNVDILWRPDNAHDLKLGFPYT